MLVVLGGFVWMAKGGLVGYLVFHYVVVGFRVEKWVVGFMIVVWRSAPVGV